MACFHSSTYYSLEIVGSGSELLIQMCTIFYSILRTHILILQIIKLCVSLVGLVCKKVFKLQYFIHLQLFLVVSLNFLLPFALSVKPKPSIFGMLMEN